MGTSRSQPSPSLTQPVSAPRPAFCLPDAPSQLSADSWACFTEAQKEALVWSCANSQSLNQNQALGLIKVGKLQAGQETQGRGRQCMPAPSPSQAPGVAFQSLLPSQLRKALEGDGYISLP